MELKDYIRSTLDGSKRGITRVLNTLTQQELMWRPASGCNSMGLLLFHIARSEDSFVQDYLQGKPHIWESEKWCNRLNMKEDDMGSHYTIDQVNGFIVPDMNDLLAYYGDVREKTLGYLDNLTPDEFDKKVKLQFGEFNVAGIFSIIVSHTAQHIGEISYQRGMLRGTDK
jgi:hypothetical protein